MELLQPEELSSRGTGFPKKKALGLELRFPRRRQIIMLKSLGGTEIMEKNPYPEFDLSGKVANVSGAGRGMGSHFAAALARYVHAVDLDLVINFFLAAISPAPNTGR